MVYCPDGCVLPTVLMALDAPTGLNVVVGADALSLVWDPVPGAVKYSVDIEGTATYEAIVDEVLVQLTADVEVSFGTSDRTDGLGMDVPSLTITFEELAAAIAAELGIDPSALVSLDEASAKVKALDPGKDKGPQNNPFSDPFDFSVTF